MLFTTVDHWRVLLRIDGFLTLPGTTTELLEFPYRADRVTSVIVPLPQRLTRAFLQLASHHSHPLPNHRTGLSTKHLQSHPYLGLLYN